MLMREHLRLVMVHQLCKTFSSRQPRQVAGTASRRLSIATATEVIAAYRHDNMHAGTGRDRVVFRMAVLKAPQPEASSDHDYGMGQQLTA
jgi:hypothetical protein